MPEKRVTNYFEVSKLSSLMSTSRKKFKEEFQKYDEKSAKKLYCAISVEIIQAISSGSIKNFEKLIKLIECIKSCRNEFHEDFDRSVEGSLVTLNFIILSCKYTQVSILEYVFNNSKLLNLFSNDGQALVKPEDVDIDGHSAFYYAIRSGDCKLVETLVKKWPHEYFQVTAEDLISLLARSYEALKLKCVALSDEMQIQVESLIIDYRFFAGTKIKDKIIISHNDINRRIDLIIDNINLLLQKYLTATLDNSFFHIARFIAQNIHILKRQLKSTYNKLPWEEIEFCIIAFLSNVRRKQYPSHHRVISNFFLTKDKLFNYLSKFSNALGIEKYHINNLSIQKLAVLPSIQREKVITLIIKHNPEFTELYNEYRNLRDTHSLEVINEYLKLASSTSPKDREGQLIIVRALQVIGEYFKNTLESPKLSAIISEMLLSSLPPNSRKLITSLRNSLSHAFSLSQRLQLEEDADDNFFTNLQQDIKVIHRVVVNMLYQIRYQHIKKILKNIIECKNSDEVRNVLETFDFNLENWFAGGEVDDNPQMMEWIEELNSLIPEDDIIGKNLLLEVKKLITVEFTSKENTSNYMTIMMMIKNIRNSIYEKYINVNYLRGLKFQSEQILLSIDLNVDAKTKKRIELACSNIFQVIKLKISFDGLMQAWGLISKIMYKLGCDPQNMQWILEFSDKLNEKKVDNCNISNREVNDNQNDRKINKMYRLNQSYTVKLSALQNILNQLDFTNYRNSKKLQVVVEMLVLDILSILNDPKKNILTDNQLFLDNYSPVLIGKNLRNHLAHDNDIVKIIPFDSMISVFLNAKKFIAENIVGSNQEIGQITQNNLSKLMKKYEQDLETIVNQEEMFCALEEGNLKKLKETLKKGADINGNNVQSWTALHFACKGPSIDVVKFVIGQNVDLKVTNNFHESALHIAAEYGRKSTVEFLIKNGCDVNELNDLLQTALHKAAESGHAEIVKILLQNKANANIKNWQGFSPLHSAVLTNKKDVVEILLQQERHADFNEISGGFTALHLAAECGHTELVKHLLKCKANVNAKSHQKATPLLGAAINGHLEVVKMLISHGADIHIVSIDGITALHNAVETNREEIVKVLLQHNVDVNFTPFQGTIDNFAPINYAAEKGFVSMLKLLLKYNARVNISTTDGRTPLHFAALYGHIDIIDILIENKAIIDAKNINNQTPLHFAASKGHDNAVEFLLKKGASHKITDSKMLTSLHVAAWSGYCKCVDVLLKYNADIRAKNGDGQTALHLSSLSGHHETSKLLITKGADINAKDLNGYTSLHIASLANEVKIIEVLINSGANVSLLDNKDCSALELSVLSGHTDVVRYFIHNKLPIDHEKINSTSLFIALNHNNQEIVKMIIENIPINIKSKKSVEMLRCAACNNQVEIVKLLLKLGVPVKIGLDEAITLAVAAGFKNIVHTLINHGNIDINEKMEGIMTLLHVAVNQNQKITAELLLAKGANVNAIGSDGTSPLHLAASEGYFDIIKLLLHNEADSSLKDIKNRTALELALKDTHDHIKSFKILFEFKKIDVNYLFNNDENWTLLHLSAQFGSLPITEYLIEKGADIHLQNKSGSKPIHIAAREGYEHLVEYYLDKNIDMYDKGAAGWTLLHYAVFGNRINVVNYLIKKQFNVNIIDCSFQTPLHWASHLGFDDVARILLNNDAIYDVTNMIVKKPSEIAGNSTVAEIFNYIDLLFTAVKQNNIDEVKYCIDKKVVVNAVNIDHTTALHYAAWKGCTEIAEILLSSGANPNISSKNGSTPLHYAAKFGYLQIVQLLLSGGASYNAKTNKNNTPLKLATSPEIIKLLELINQSFTNIERGNAKVIDDLKNINSLDVVKAVMNARNSDEKTLMVMAFHKKFSKVDDLKDIFLGNYKTSMDTIYKLLLHERYQEALDLCHCILQRRKKYLNSNDPGILEVEYTVGYIIYKQQNYQKALDIVTIIYNKQKDILGANNSNTLKTNCLMAMALHRLGRNNEALILFRETYDKQSKILVADNNDLLTTQIQMGLVLMQLQKYEEALFFYKKALEKKLNSRDFYNVLVIQNNIAMVYCLQGKYTEAMDKYQNVYELRKELLGPNHSDTLRAMFNKIEVLVKQEKYNDALTAFKEFLISQNKALGPNHVDTLTTKLQIGNIYFLQGKTVDAMKIFTSIQRPLAQILGLNHPEIKILMTKIESIQRTYQYSGSDILKCCQSNDEISEAVKSKELIEALLNSDFDINSKDSNGLTLLHYAINNQNENIVRFLLKSNSDCCSLSSKGNTALHFAVIKNNKGIVCTLLEHAKQVLKRSEVYNFINTKTKNGGMTCMHVAAQKGFEDIVEILLENGAIFNCTNYTGNKTPYDLCDNNNIKQLLTLIDELFFDANHGNNLLIIKLKRFDVTKMKIILNTRNIAGETLINVALLNRHKNLARKLLEILKNPH